MLGISRKNVGRATHIASVFARHGWGAMIERLGLGSYVRVKRGALSDMTPAGVREALEELGPTFIKLGQMLSTRPDIIPEEYAKELAKLQDTAPTVPASEIHEVICEEFGRCAEEVYSSFDDQPIAAASLGQVHAAMLPDGTEVMVKVQRPGIRDMVETDIEILYRFTRFLEGRWDKARSYGLMDLADEFSTLIREEMDYTREGRNTDRLRVNLAECDEVRVPLVYWDLTTSKVLTIQRFHGIKISQIDELKARGYDPSTVANRLAVVFLKQIYVDGFFHADPHPGNILVADDQIIELVDCGQVGHLDATSKNGAIRLLVAFEQEDTTKFAETIMALGVALGDVDMKHFTRDIEKLLRHFYDLPARSINIGTLLIRTMEVSVKHRVRLPASFALLGKVLATIDSINGQLDPSYNFTETARPYLSRAVKQEFKLSNLSTDMYRSLIDIKALIMGLPDHLQQIMRKMVEGSFRIEFKHEGLDDLSSKIERAANRLAFALIIVGVIVGSSLVVVAGKGPTGWYGYPILGIIGYLFATVLGMYLVIQIIKSGRLH